MHFLHFLLQPLSLAQLSVIIFLPFPGEFIYCSGFVDSLLVTISQFLSHKFHYLFSYLRELVLGLKKHTTVDEYALQILKCDFNVNCYVSIFTNYYCHSLQGHIMFISISEPSLSFKTFLLHNTE